VAARAADSSATPGDAAGALAVEWFAAYGDFLKRTAGQSTSTIELYQQVMDRIVGGRLAPTAAQDMLAAFVRERGTTYSDELARLNARFFTEMVRIGTTYAHELGQAVLPGAGVPPEPPPAFDAANPAGWFQDLSAYSQRLGTSFAATYQTLVERAAAGEVAPGQVQEAAAGFLQRRLLEYVGDLARLYFELLNDLTELRVRSEQEFLSGVLSRADGNDGRFELGLTAPLGETATASLAIANTRDEVARIRCHITDVRREDAVGPAFAPDVDVVPEPLELAPGEEARLALMLRLGVATYEPGLLYVATLHITGHGEPRMEVPLRIAPTAPVATAAE
jgi:hypothetical protein